MTTPLEAWRHDVNRMLPARKRIRAAFLSQGVWAVTVFRLGQGISRLPRPVEACLNVLFAPLEKLVQCMTGIDLPSTAEIGPGLYIGHFGGIIVNSKVRIGSDVNLSQQVTIGVGGFGSARGVPTIGDRVYLGPGSKLFGRISVGDDCIIGANAVVNRSVPSGSVVAGVPARIIRAAKPEEITEVIYGIVAPAEHQQVRMAHPIKDVR